MAFPNVRLVVSAAILALGSAAPGCKGGSDLPARGDSRPTVAGGKAPAYADLKSAQAAFARSDGDMTAILEDAAWIRLEPDADLAAQKHASYMQGLTTIDVSLVTDGFVRPTDEVYVLTDSTGASVTAKPLTYRGVTDAKARKHLASFTLEFRHVMSKSVKWLRLTRQGAGGGTVEWDFPG